MGNKDLTHRTASSSSPTEATAADVPNGVYIVFHQRLCQAVAGILFHPPQNLSHLDSFLEVEIPFSNNRSCLKKE